MRCVIIDDEPYALDLIKDYTERTPFLTLADAFSNPYKALDFLNRVPVDLVFLDINMPELSGIQLIRSLQSPPMIVFTTAYPEFAAESYEYNAIDYLVKPIKYERFLKAVNKASVIFHSNSASVGFDSKVTTDHKDDSIFIKSGTQLVKLNPDDILYVEAAGNYMQFIAKDKRVMSLLTMKEVLELLPSDNFVRIHKSYIISLKHLTAIERHDAVIGGKQIPIGITYREHFFKRMGR
jgi:two-component system, LytTR family, response regulator